MYEAFAPNASYAMRSEQAGPRARGAPPRIGQPGGPLLDLSGWPVWGGDAEGRFYRGSVFFLPPEVSSFGPAGREEKAVQTASLLSRSVTPRSGCLPQEGLPGRLRGEGSVGAGLRGRKSR